MSSVFYFVNENDDSVCLTFRNLDHNRTIGLINSKPVAHSAGVCIVSNCALPTEETSKFLLVANFGLGLLVATSTEGPGASTLYLVPIYFLGLWFAFRRSQLGLKMFSALLGSTYLLAENPIFYRIPLDIISIWAAFHVSRLDDIAWVIPDPHRRQA